MALLNVTLPWNVSLDLNHSYFKSNLSELEDAQPMEKNWPAPVYSGHYIFTVAGNILVIMAVSIESKLHNATNYFLCSLAVADMLVGFLVMPASLISILYSKYFFKGNLPGFKCTFKGAHLKMKSLTKAVKKRLKNYNSHKSNSFLTDKKYCH